MGAEDLGKVLKKLPLPNDPNLLVGIATGDDAAVYRISDDAAIVATVDYFSPVVDDAYDFGRVAAANSLSDIYAMGGRPLLALNIIGFPATKLPLEIMGEILRGGAEKAKDAGIAIAGGHSIDDAEPKYGLAVIGIIRPDAIARNSSAKPGDILYLTKPLGTGILTTAIKKGKLSAAKTREITEIMATLNRAAGEAMNEVGVHACTDITGFGLIGHLTGMTKGSGVSARISLSALPIIDGTREAVRNGIWPGGTKRNLDYYGKNIRWDGSIGEDDRLICADAQTSGGLLIAVSPEKAKQIESALLRGGVVAVRVGEILPRAGFDIDVVA